MPDQIDEILPDKNGENGSRRKEGAELGSNLVRRFPRREMAHTFQRKDLNILAHSDGVHWIRQDTGAQIV